MSNDLKEVREGAATISGQMSLQTEGIARVKDLRWYYNWHDLEMATVAEAKLVRIGTRSKDNRGQLYRAFKIVGKV